MAALIITALMQASLSLASPGITGYSGKSGSYCNSCHSGGAVPTVTISGPATVAPGSVNSYTLTITGGPLADGACDIAVSGGALAAGSGDSLKSSEIVGGPTAPTSSAVSFPFTWTAPATAGTYTIYGAGNSVNGNNSTSGDGAAAKQLVVTVSGGGGTATLSGLAIQGATSVTGGTTATYTAQASYSNGTSKAVTPSWSVTPTTYASINTSGVLTAKTVTSNQTVTVGASYTEGGVTKTASTSVSITSQPTTATLTGLTIQGAGSVKGGTSTTYTAQASYSNGTSKAVTPSWSVTPTTYASINTGGVLTTKTVTSNQTVTVAAGYTENGVTKTASAGVTITTSGTTGATLTNLEVKGPASVVGGSSATYSALASYSDGSSRSVTATWSVTPTSYATINKTSGALTAAKVTASQAVTVTANCTQGSVSKTATLDVVIDSGIKPAIGSVNSSGVIVLASNDLGMHCVCPSFSKFMILPPFNTIRAQVIRKGGEDPQVMGSSSGIRVAYSFSENTDASLSADPYYQDWMKNAPKLGFKAYPAKDSAGHIQSPITGTKLAGNMTAQTGGWWEAVGIPVYPDASNLSTAKPMTDPLGGPNRNPYLTGNIKVYNSSNTLLAQTSITVPSAFGGCCSCHLGVAAQLGYPATSEGSFEAMGFLHSTNTSGIDISQIDPDGDGVPGPIRCSQCHLDPAMGEKTAPGGYKLNGKTLPVSRYTFSDVLHRFHAQDGMVLAQYDVNIAKDCYQCHPGNGINCYRDHHMNESMNGSTKLWCTDCHGDLNQRIAQNQMAQPWSVATLPKCSKCHTGTIGENATLDVFGGTFLNSMTHGGPLLCSTCHGSPHALNASTLAHDNMQNAALQGGNTNAIGVCNVCHTNRSTSYGKPPHSRGD